MAGTAYRLAAQHLGHLARQQVAHDPAPDRRDDAHEDGRDGRDPQRRHGLEAARDGEGAEAGGVEHADEAGDALDARVEEERDEAAERRGGQQPPVADADRRDVADEQVAHDAAAEGRSAGQHEHPEEVEALLDGHEATGEREDEHADEVEGEPARTRKR